MSGIIIADYSPLIGLARIGQLELLHLLYAEIWIPPTVHAELKPDAQRPGSQKLKAALDTRKTGYRLSNPLIKTLLELTGE